MTYQFQQQTQQVIDLAKVPAPTGEDRYSDWEIESLLGLLYDKAIEIGEQHSQAHFSRTGKYAPLAYQASTGFKMVEIVRQLQADIANGATETIVRLQAELDTSKEEITRLNAIIKESGVWIKPVRRVKKKDPAETDTKVED